MNPKDAHAVGIGDGAFRESGKKEVMDQVLLVYAQWALGVLPSERLPEFASDWIREGVETPLTQQLAGMTPDDISNPRETLEGILNEIGEEIPDQEECRWIYVRFIAREVSGGRLPVEKAAVFMEKRLPRRLETLDSIVERVLSPEVKGREREACKKTVVRYCRQLSLLSSGEIKVEEWEGPENVRRSFWDIGIFWVILIALLAIGFGLYLAAKLVNTFGGPIRDINGI